MNGFILTLLTAGCLVAASVGAFAQSISLPIDFRQGDIRYNFRSQRGVPISSVPNVPSGSDGRMTNVNDSAGSVLLPTTNQFRGFISFGAVAGQTLSGWQTSSNSTLLRGTTPFSGAVAVAMNLPVGTSNNLPGGSVAILMRLGQVGAPYLSRQLSFAFGSVVDVPLTDETGRPLNNIASSAYWLPEPFTTTSHTNSGYYWSPHARKVYAIQAGPLQVTWRKATYVTGLPNDYVSTTNITASGTNVVANYQNISGNYFRLYTVNYVVSGSAVKPTRKMYWTEKSFRNLGKPVAVPTARVGAVTFAYNRDFERTVNVEYSGPGDTSPTEGSTNQVLRELRTLWYDQQQGSILAFNKEGRIFLELLGDSRSDGQTRESLGFEIVDVVKNPAPIDVTSELGERIPSPVPDPLGELTPEPVLQLGDKSFAYQQFVAGSGILKLYATRETSNLNDYLVHWMELGEAGLRWPEALGRYRLVWPPDAAKYSHYVRPLVETESEAKATAVPLPTANAPTIEYQDPLDAVRGKLTETFAYYTFLDAAHPLHRALLRFNTSDQVAFERVFSWLDTGLKAQDYSGNAIATGLLAWNSNSRSLVWPDVLKAPRVVSQVVDVGSRISAPDRELGATGDYLAGHINLTAGTLFNSNAYVDPFVAGFDAANLGAIIPVNAIPGENGLEVWWFRRNAPSAGANAANATLGFLPVYWPSVLGRYSIRWPVSPREIVLASQKGSGTLDPLEALGTIYSQNDPSLLGYNPNEEHAIMSGGSAYATRDDLNMTNGVGRASYSSQPFVLVEYAAQDGRPKMSAFKVLREKPSAGWVFDYVSPAGRLLQPPMPLPLLGKPVEGSGDGAENFNTEPLREQADLPGGWETDLGFALVFIGEETRVPSQWSVPEGFAYPHYVQFTYIDRNKDRWVYRGLHAGLPALEAGTYDAGNQRFVPLTNATAVAGQPFALSLHASREFQYLGLTLSNAPAWLGVSVDTNVPPLTLVGTPSAADVGTNIVQLVVSDLYNQSRVTNRLTLRVLSSGLVVAQKPLVLASTNTFTGSIVNFSNRPPFLARSADPLNSFTMRYYYKTEPSFAWPGVATPPPAGSIVPYLRRVDESGAFVGDPTDKNSAALDIVYRPVWPESDPSDSTKPLPKIPYGLTLVKPQLGLPGVGDWKTARVLYQQSIASDVFKAQSTVVLHDPTREKTADILSFDMQELPAGVRTQPFQGKIYFPTLPPHLAKRLFFDPARGAKGSLVLAGEFKDEVVGEDYLLLNVLRGSDLTNAFGLCPTGDDVNYKKWTNAITSLETQLETFGESPTTPGTYIVDSRQRVGVQEIAQVDSDNVAVDSYALSATGPGSGYVTLVEAGGNGKFTKPGDPVALHIFRVDDSLHSGELKFIPSENPLSELVTFQHTPDLGGRFDEYEYEWKIGAPVDGLPPLTDATMSRYLALTAGTNQPRYTLGGADIRVLGDNYLVLRYRSISPSHPLYNQWSEWTQPQLAEGWIKRVLAGINPFNQRTKDLFNNAANTDASILTSAGHRWEGDVALNLDTINNYGLIEVYETVLRRGRSISIESGYNYGPANDALLLAAGYLNDLYMMVGNEAWADAANPTIGIGTANNIYGDIATALFPFKGQVPSLLEEELALLRGRDDSLQPGVAVAPVYNRLFWNYTRGIDAGEVIYAINYNIQENPDRSSDGVINATDAARMFPQGHGDAYGHYLTALKGYYSLLLNNNFDWVPRIEAVTVLGQPVSVDYQDERKFAAASVAVARAGRQILDLTWRKDYQAGHDVGWSSFASTRVNTQRTYNGAGGIPVHPTRYWGLDHWASRNGQGNYIHWLVGNAILPAVDPNPAHEGIQKIDRTTVPELTELATMASDLQSALDSAEGGLTPLGLADGSVALDINPNVVVGPDNGTHFEQTYSRAKTTLNNAVAAFDDAKDVTRLMRSEQDSLASFQAGVDRQELAYNNSLIELYGSPYTDDIGVGKTWKQGYAGPDLIHYMYVETPEQAFPSLWNYAAETDTDWKIDIQNFPSNWATNYSLTGLNVVDQNFSNTYTNKPKKDPLYISFHLDPHGFGRPKDWTGRRASPGRIQQAISGVITASANLRRAVYDNAGGKGDLDRAIGLFRSKVDTHNQIRSYQESLLTADQILKSAQFANEIFGKSLDISDELSSMYAKALMEGLPKFLIAGLANGGDFTSPGRAAILAAEGTKLGIFKGLHYAADFVVKSLDFSTETARRWVEFQKIAPLEWDQEVYSAVADLGNQMEKIQASLYDINTRLRELDDAQRAYQAVLAEGDRIQLERQTIRQRTAAVVQGYRTRDAAFRIFRNEKLERYKSLFDLAARYAFLAANAYDYETGLLNTTAGRRFVNRIVSARALGVVRNGEPQYAGSNTGDPGLSSALAEMKADWDTVKGRLGLNNPDAYGTTVSLRTENFRILPSTNGDTAWVDLLHQSRRRNVAEDEDVRRHCLQISRADGLPVPGIILEFSTSITDGNNLFGQPGAAGDHAFSPSSFATKIFGVGVALEGYRGMDQPASNGGVGGNSPSDPNLWYLDPLALMATPYVYLVPVGVDFMRSPPLGDADAIRSWTVDDVAIPLPFNIGASALSAGGLYQSANSLSEPLFTVRKHQAFRPVPSASYFSTSLYGTGGTLQRSQYTNNRLIGRSVWNSKWKLVIPGHTMLNDPNEALERFIKTVRDIKLHFVTYSYSGN